MESAKLLPGAGACKARDCPVRARTTRQCLSGNQIVRVRRGHPPPGSIAAACSSVNGDPTFEVELLSRFGYEASRTDSHTCEGTQHGIDRVCIVGQQATLFRGKGQSDPDRVDDPLPVIGRVCVGLGVVLMRKTPVAELRRRKGFRDESFSHTCPRPQRSARGVKQCHTRNRHRRTPSGSRPGRRTNVDAALAPEQLRLAIDLLPPWQVLRYEFAREVGALAERPLCARQRTHSREQRSMVLTVRFTRSVAYPRLRRARTASARSRAGHPSM